MQKNKLIIFDMDNTLLHSRIDFARMKYETCRILGEIGIVLDQSLPVAEILNDCKNQEQLPPWQEEKIWRAICEIEAEGLANATSEPGVELVLEKLLPKAHVVLLTNTNHEAAQQSLTRLGLARCFEHILGRGAVPELKPGPGGMQKILGLYPHLGPSQALALGDALIDILAAHRAGLRFCAYNRSRQEDWSAADYPPDLQLKVWDEGAADALLSLLPD